MRKNLKYRLSPYGEYGWLAEFTEGRDQIETALFANAVADSLRQQDGISDSIAGVASVAIKTDPLQSCINEAKSLLQDAIEKTPATPATSATCLEIPVCYGGEYGPDIDSVSKLTGCTSDQVISLHMEGRYHVLSVGFAPGFAYLGPLPEALQVARLDTPRAHLPPGSVAIAGNMTGVYPLASPGGWRIIGRTPSTLFDPDAETPFLFRPGMEIRFTPIDRNTFQKMTSDAS